MSAAIALCRRHRSLGCCMIVFTSTRRTAAFTSQVGCTMQNKLSTPRRCYPQQSLPEASRANNPTSQHRKRASNTQQRQPPCSALGRSSLRRKALCNTSKPRRRRYCVWMAELRKIGVGTSLQCRTPSLGRRLRSCCFSGASLCCVGQLLCAFDM
jgi:hypothetical protein